MGFRCIKNWVDNDLVVDPDGADPFPQRHLDSWISDITTRIVNHISKQYDHNVYGNDVDAYTVKAEELIARVDVSQNPYYKADSTFLGVFDTLFSETFDTATSQVVKDTLLMERVTVKDSFSSVPFPGAILVSHNVWEVKKNLYDLGHWEFDFPLLKESNYIITNPVRNNDHVTRGHLALPFGYPIKKFAEAITGSTDFPDPKAKLSNQVQTARYFSHKLWGGLRAAELASLSSGSGVAAFAIGHALTRMAPGILANTTKEDNQRNTFLAIQAVQSSCPGLSPSPDLVSACLIGRPIQPQNPLYWKDLWFALGERLAFREAAKGRFQANLIHNIEMASGTWGHDDFSDWASKMGMSYSELFYSTLHGGFPKKSETFYRDALLKAQCEGTFNAGWSVNDSTIQPAYEHVAPFNTENVFSQLHKG